MIRHKNSLTCLIFELKFLSHVIYQCKMLKLFLGIFIYFTRIFRNILTWFSDPVSDPVLCWQARSVDRTVDRTKGRSTVAIDRRAQPCARLADTGPVDRSVDRTRERCSLYLGGRPSGRPDQRVLLSVSGRSTGLLQRSYFWPLAVDRPVDRQPVRLTDQPNG